MQQQLRSMILRVVQLKQHPYPMEAVPPVLSWAMRLILKKLATLR